MPQVYKELGLSDGMVRTNKDVILKDSIEKHYVPLNVVEDLPELFADPIMVMDSRSVDGRLVAVLNAVDKKGQQVIVAISPNKKQEGGYHFIPSFYGKTKISNFIETNIKEGNLKYIKSQQALDTLQLRPQVKTLLGSLNNNILQKSDIVKKNQQKFFQGENENARASYSPISRTIHLFKNADHSSLIHELGHHFTMRYTRLLEETGRMDELEGFYNWLGINDISEAKTETWEQMARGFETYVMEGVAPNADTENLFQRFRQYLINIYNGFKPQEINDDVRDFFDKMIAGAEEAPDIRGLQGKIEHIGEVIKGALKGEEVLSLVYLKRKSLLF